MKKEEIDRIEAEEKRKKDLALQEEQAAQLRKERYLAIQKRNEATRMAEKRKRAIAVIVVAGIIIAFLVLIGVIIGKTLYDSEPRNFATEKMNEDYSNVYADLISIDPIYITSSTITTKHSTFFSGGDIICKCITVEGKTIWVAFNSYQYPRGDDKTEDGYQPLTYSESSPLRVIGRPRKSGKVSDKLPQSIGNVLVLEISSVIKN
ncbi:MAG: hypothetical protein ILO53_01280 [Clostridia bacterium]|nr:hypothetical protein [Clostridia bacterium]